MEPWNGWCCRYFFSSACCHGDRSGNCLFAAQVEVGRLAMPKGSSGPLRPVVCRFPRRLLQKLAQLVKFGRRYLALNFV
jgi:hypothetical protein